MKREKLQIKLAEIPAEGKSYHYSSQSGELTHVLNDLVSDKSFDISFNIRPIGNIYEIKGSVQANLPRVCSRCGWDIEIPVNKQISELILPKAEEAKGDAHVKSGSLADAPEDMAVVFVSEGVLDAAEFAHEMVAISDPTYPDCGKSDCENLLEVQRKMQALAAEASEAVGSPKANPFDILKSLRTRQ
jgi:uncharacterized protein